MVPGILFALNLVSEKYAVRDIWGWGREKEEEKKK